jgi:hypothetical protein
MSARPLARSPTLQEHCDEQGPGRAHAHRVHDVLDGQSSFLFCALYAQRVPAQSLLLAETRTR